ncbi:MAG: terminase family protein [Terricaulis sp.]
MKNDWRFWGRKAQLDPESAWRTWLFLGGRGAGKTRAGAQWVSAQAALWARSWPDRADRADVSTMCAKSWSMARRVCALCRTSGPIYEVTRRRVLWSNGAEALCFSAEDPESLRGPQFDAAWADELCIWPHPDETLMTLSHGLRLGHRPQLMATTTPRPIKALPKADGGERRGGDDQHELGQLPQSREGFLRELVSSAGRARRTNRQELFGDLIDDPEGALWKRADLEALRTRDFAAPERVVVAVDPPASIGANADACGIVAAGASGEGFGAPRDRAGGPKRNWPLAARLGRTRSKPCAHDRRRRDRRGGK